MNSNHLCPECGSPMESGEQFCGNCGASLPQLPEKKVAADDNIIGAGARANVTGGIHKSSTSNTNVNTSSVDNSSTVNNNTTIVMGGQKTEFCEVCGNPLGEKHARCPKCGKHICFDCKVEGKNRCMECEKKYINEYRVAFQQLLLTTGGNIGIAGRQMMDQKARELDIENVKDKVEAEVIAMVMPDKSASRSQESNAVAPVSKNVQPEPKGANAPRPLVGGAAAAPGTASVRANGKKGSKTGLIVAAVLAVIVAGVFLWMPKGNDDAASSISATEQQQKVVEEKPAVPEKKAEIPSKKTQPVAQPAAQPVTQSVAQPAQPESSAPTEKKVDADYEAGMAAYKGGNGLEAVNAFTKSGSAESYYMIGLIYKNGCGTIGKNEMMARKNFKKAASMGHKEAKSQL